MAHISRDDDRFRVQGSQFQNEEPVAVAVVEQAALIDWSNDSRTPASTLWLPETLYATIAQGTLLRHFELHSQTKLDCTICVNLVQELTTLVVECTNPDLSLAATLLLDRVRLVAESTGGEWLLIEGP